MEAELSSETLIITRKTAWLHNPYTKQEMRLYTALIFICVLFNDAVGSKVCAASNNR